MSIENYRCDRCGLVFSTHKMDQQGMGLQYYTLDHKHTQWYHLCTECAVDFSKFLDEKHDEKIVPYRK